MNSTLSDSELSKSARQRIIAISSGKGGLGASMIATNLAIFMAQIGKRVLLVDANLPDAGLHSWLGMSKPKLSIQDILDQRVASSEEALVPTSISGLSLMGGSVDMSGGRHLNRNDRSGLISALKEVEADFILVDLPTGLHPLGLDLLGAADTALLVSAATPDAVEATYRLISAVYLLRVLNHPALDDLSKLVLDDLVIRVDNFPTPREIIDVLESTGCKMTETAKEIASIFHPQLVINMIRVKSDHSIGEAIVGATSRWLGIVPKLLGTVDWDDNVWLSLRRGNPLLIDFPQSRACRGLERVVRRLLGQSTRELTTPAPIPKPTADQNLYELLEIYPGASEEEVRRGYKQVKEYFGTNGLAISGLCSEKEQAEYQKRAKQAHEVLIDRSKRREYDKTMFPEGFPKAPEKFEDGRKALAGSVASPHDSLPTVDLREDQMVTGAFLGEIRKERGIELVDISNRAKISISYLKAIEEEKYEELPARVYIRGFVTEFARYLKIDPKRAVSDFMATYDAHLSKRAKAR
jgi:flagellar biosynthesis protein FlhG